MNLTSLRLLLAAAVLMPMTGCAIGQDWACGMDVVLAPVALAAAALVGFIGAWFVPYRVLENRTIRVAFPIAVVVLALAGYVYGVHTMAGLFDPWDSCL